MRNIISILFLAALFSCSESFARGQVPYYKTRHEDGKECRYFYSGVQNGQENLVAVQCFDEK